MKRIVCRMLIKSYARSAGSAEAHKSVANSCCLQCNSAVLFDVFLLLLLCRLCLFMKRIVCRMLIKSYARSAGSAEAHKSVAEFMLPAMQLSCLV